MFQDLEELIRKTVPSSILLDQDLKLEEPVGKHYNDVAVFFSVITFRE